MIPTPKFAIIYNGRRNRPATETLKLSDLFENPTDNPQIELTCTAYNINPGNTGLLEECGVKMSILHLLKRLENMRELRLKSL